MTCGFIDCDLGRDTRQRSLLHIRFVGAKTSVFMLDKRTRSATIGKQKLAMTSLRQKECDILRQRKNDPDPAYSRPCYLPVKSLGETLAKPRQFLLNDRQSFNHRSAGT